jgi:Mg2+ and Co2+ transporter CorA
MQRKYEFHVGTFISREAALELQDVAEMHKQSEFASLLENSKEMFTLVKDHQQKVHELEQKLTELEQQLTEQRQQLTEQRQQLTEQKTALKDQKKMFSGFLRQIASNMTAFAEQL